MDFTNIFNDRKNEEYLLDLEKLFIFTHKIYDKFENEFPKPICILIKCNSSKLYELSRMIHSFFLLKRQLSLDSILPVENIKSLSKFSIEDEEGKYDHSLCNLALLLDVVLLTDANENILQVVLGALIKRLFEKECSVINYVENEADLEDKMRFFRKTGYQVEVFDTEEMNEYTREKYQQILQGLHFALTLLTWRMMMENPDNPDLVRGMVMKSEEILDLGFVLEEVNLEELFDNIKKKI